MTDHEHSSPLIAASLMRATELLLNARHLAFEILLIGSLIPSSAIINFLSDTVLGVPSFYLVEGLRLLMFLAVIGMLMLSCPHLGTYYFDRISLACVLVLGGLVRPVPVGAPGWFVVLDFVAFAIPALLTYRWLRRRRAFALGQWSLLPRYLLLAALTATGLVVVLVLFGVLIRWFDRGGLSLAWQSLGGFLPVNSLFPHAVWDLLQHQRQGPALGTSLSPWRVLGTFLTWMSSSAVIEEPVYRGFLLGYLVHKRGWDAPKAIVAQAILFTLSHPHTLSKPLVFFIALPLSGIVYGWLTIRTRNISTSMFSHALHNTIVSLI